MANSTSGGCLSSAAVVGHRYKVARVDEAESMLEKNMREKKGGKDAKVVNVWLCEPGQQRLKFTGNLGRKSSSAS